MLYDEDNLKMTNRIRNIGADPQAFSKLVPNHGQDKCLTSGKTLECNLWSDHGGSRIEVTPNETRLEKTKEETEKLAESLTEEVIQFLKKARLPINRYSTSHTVNLLFIDSGGKTGSSIFTYGLAKFSDGVRLFLYIHRDIDDGTDKYEGSNHTIMGYLLKYPEGVTRENITKHIKHLLCEGSSILWQRQQMRNQFESRVN